MRLASFLATVFPHLAVLHVEAITVSNQHLTLVVSPTCRTARCPSCQRRSRRVHRHFVRTLADAPVARYRVHLDLHARRFRCVNPACPRQTFRERLASVAPVYQRRTPVLCQALERVGFALGGQAGARLAVHLGLGPTGASRNTLLRITRRAELPAVKTPRVLGVDDWSVRRGRTYGTLLVDLEQHRPVDLLPDRSAETLAAWLTQHPGVQVVSRDRGGAYADGARRGAPEAVQVADRFHLVKNAAEALEQVLIRQHALLRTAATEAGGLAARQEAASVPTEQPVPPQHTQTATSPTATAMTDMTGTTATPRLPEGPRTRVQREQQARLARRVARYEEVQALHTQGYSFRAIAQHIGLNRATVTRLCRAEAPPDERQHRAPRPSLLDPFEPYLRERWATGEHNTAQLYAEIREQGFPGSAVLVRQRLARWRARPGRPGVPARGASRDATPAPPPPPRTFSPRQTLWLLLRTDAASPEGDLDAQERAYLARVRELSPTIHQAQDLVQRFRRLVRERDLASFGDWWIQASRSTVPEVRGFARGLHRDRSAVEAALASDWNNGQSEGQINRLKLLKRQAYGRASFDLLRRRVLYAA